MLNGMGYIPTTRPEYADILIVNSCNVREKSVVKLFSEIGRLGKIKKRRGGNALLCVMGCVAQERGAELMERFSYVDIVSGPDGVKHIPAFIDRVKSHGEKVVYQEFDKEFDDFDRSSTPFAMPRTKVSKFITIMKGCNNFCSFCTVPYVRGPEVSRRMADIEREVEYYVEMGTKEVYLLGQNVNSYKCPETGADFKDLLMRLNEISGLLRIRFTTSHPKDLSKELVEALSTLKKVAKAIHLPLQSGSTKVLKDMNRGYSKEEYIDKIETLRSAIPGIAITTDLIVGFPGEDDRDFQETLDVVQKVRFDSAFTFKFSKRRNTLAYRFPDDVPEDEKRRRLHILNGIIERITHEKNIEMEGKVVEVLVEGNSKRGCYFSGRESGGRVVNFSAGDDYKVSSEALLQVEVLRGLKHSLLGKMKIL